MIVDRIENWKHYCNDPLWQQAFEYLAALDANTPECEMTSLAGNDLKVRVMSYETRAPENAVLEAHDRYVDIQASLDNAEVIGWFPRAGLEIKTPYDPESDAVFFNPPGPPRAFIVNRPGCFTVLLPQDAHMPQLHPGPDCVQVKKVVFKLRVEHFRPITG